MSSFNVDDAANRMLISFSFSKLLLSLRSKFFMSVADLQSCSRSVTRLISQLTRLIFLTVFVSHCTGMEWLVDVWYMTRNGSNELAKKEKICSLAGVSRSSMADLKCSSLFHLGLFDFGNFAQWLTMATMCFQISTKQSAAALYCTYLQMIKKSHKIQQKGDLKELYSI